LHELSLTQSIVDICLQHGAGRRVTVVVLEIGDLSGVVPDAVEFCFDACSRGTLLEGARLVIERVLARATCHDCGGEFPVSTYFDPCPTCGGFSHAIVSGEELRVKELEVE
jgi:hydrogenase nickel incorporation protein HypA/HybF